MNKNKTTTSHDDLFEGINPIIPLVMTEEEWRSPRLGINTNFGYVVINDKRYVFIDKEGGLQGWKNDKTGCMLCLVDFLAAYRKLGYDKITELISQGKTLDEIQAEAFHVDPRPRGWSRPSDGMKRVPISEEAMEEIRNDAAQKIEELSAQIKELKRQIGTIRKNTAKALFMDKVGYIAKLAQHKRVGSDKGGKLTYEEKWMSWKRFPEERVKHSEIQLLCTGVEMDDSGSFYGKFLRICKDGHLSPLVEVVFAREDFQWTDEFYDWDEHLKEIMTYEKNFGENICDNDDVRNRHCIWSVSDEDMEWEV